MSEWVGRGRDGSVSSMTERGRDRRNGSASATPTSPSGGRGFEFSSSAGRRGSRVSSRIGSIGEVR